MMTGLELVKGRQLYLAHMSVAVVPDAHLRIRVIRKPEPIEIRRAAGQSEMPVLVRERFTEKGSFF